MRPWRSQSLPLARARSTCSSPWARRRAAPARYYIAVRSRRASPSLSAWHRRSPPARRSRRTDMAWLIGDGFDFYAAGSADITAPGSIWINTSNPANMSTITRFSVGCSFAFSATNHYDSISFANSTTVYVNFAYLCTVAQTAGNTIGTQCILFDGTPSGGTAQVRLVMLQDGSIALATGAGTIIAGTRSAANTFIQNQWIHIQAKIVIDGSAGTFDLRINGITTP